MRIVIIGAGNMGGLIVCGLAKGTIIPANDIIVSNLTQHELDVLKVESPALQTIRNNQEAVTGAELIILAVKSWPIKPVASELKLKSKQILISIVAGIPFEELVRYVIDKETATSRLIPNTVISEMGSMTFTVSRNASKGQEQLLLDILNQMGLATLIPEDKITTATVMTSCDTAYVLKYIQATIQAGIGMGIYPKNGTRTVAQLVKGAAELILNSDTHPNIETDKVCTLDGIIIRGINGLERQGFLSAITNAIKTSK